MFVRCWWVLLAGTGLCLAESGADAWLRYQAPEARTAQAQAAALGATFTVLGDSAMLRSAGTEYARAYQSMYGRIPRAEATVRPEGGVVIGPLDRIRRALPQARVAAKLGDEAYQLTTVRTGKARYVVVTGGSDRGVLYGLFALLRKAAQGQALENLDETQTPYAPVRWLNHWDNLDGSIERGYGGKSIFWEGGHVRADLTRVAEYGRLLASLGIQATSINNVNADARVLDAGHLPEVARIAAALRPWGVRVAVSIDFASPQKTGGLDTFDPLDPRVIEWWKKKIDEMYGVVPDLAGIIIKADSEGRAGPSAYQRTHADAANVVARPLKQYGGLLFYRGFVYDHHMDWRNPKNDRARAADDNFRPLDGKFEDNAVIQIKHGPIDFQVREPASPLFGTLEKTSQAIELQITQEYFGQSRHAVFLAPMWKEALDFDMQAKGPGTPVKALVSGRVFGRPTGGFVGVSNAGLNENWFNNHLSQANLYAFGRLAWNPDLTSKEIAAEWTRLTFGANPRVGEVVNHIQLTSWSTFEHYTGPLGLQTLTDIVGNHFGVAVEASERNGWGQWHKSDEHGAGFDRSVKSGTGYAGQYRPAVAQMWEAVESTPDELILFFHHLPYTHNLHSGKTVIQHIYDVHFQGAEEVAEYVRQWRSLAGLVDERRYREILAQLEYQAGQAEVWRDAVAGWYRKTSGIADEKGRVEHPAGRVEAEAMTLDGYAPTAVRPWEGASGGTAVMCPRDLCTAQWTYSGEPGWMQIRVRYFDTNDGAARFQVRVNRQVLDEWTANDWVPTRRIDSSSSALRVVAPVMLQRGDTITVMGMPDRTETAGLDYIEVRKAP